MDTEIIIHAADYSVEKESLRIIIEKNLSWKMDTYIRKYKQPNSPIRVELTVKKENDGQAQWKLILTVGTTSYRSERENFDSLSDLVNHLFTHVKDQMVK